MSFLFDLQKRWRLLILVSILLLFMTFSSNNAVNAGPSPNNDFAELNCNTTASSAGLDLVLPIQAGAESFNTGYWVYQTTGSDHTGKDSCALDFFDVLGKHVVAVADGKVEVAKWQNKSNKSEGYGYYVIVLHEKNGVKYYSVYSHLEDPDTKDFPQKCKVVSGLDVKAGDCLGISGKTGISPIDHLHFSMWSGTGPFANTQPIAPETMRGIKLYGKLAAQKPVTTMASAESVNWIMPALYLKMNEYQSRTFEFTNTSKMIWEESNKFELVMISGKAPGVPERISLHKLIEPGKNVAIAIPIRGTSPGLFESTWQLHHNNVAFGPTIKLTYTVGVDTENISNLPSTLLELIKPIVSDYLNDLFHKHILQPIQDYLNSFFKICGLAPFSFAGIMIAMVMTGKRRHSNFIIDTKWTGRGTWLTLLGELIGSVFILLIFSILIRIGRELIWWNGVIKSTGFAILAISLFVLVWVVIRLSKWVNDLGLKRFIITILIILIPLIILHGQRYRADEPILTRYVSSISDLSWLAMDKAFDFGKESREFSNEVAILSGIKLIHSRDNQQTTPTGIPDENTLQITSTASTPDSNAIVTGTHSACILVWEEYSQDNLGGKNRSMVWNEVVKTKVKGSDMTASQFNSLVVEKNPELSKDGYVFNTGKIYKLPMCQ